MKIYRGEIPTKQLNAIAKRRRDLPRGCLAGGDALRNSDAAIGIPRKSECWNRGDKLLDLSDSVQVADVVLRHRARPAGDVHCNRQTCDMQQLPQFIQNNAPKVCIGQFEKRRLQRASDEDSNQHIISRSTAWVLQAGETTGDYSTVLNLWHNETKAIEGVVDLNSVKT